MSQLKAQLRRDGFTFKQFFVAHDRCAMKVGTDGILLGAWAPVAGVKRILDIGTGSGLQALILAQRTEEHVTIAAVELDPQASRQASENAADSPWAERIRVECADVLTWAPEQTARYDLIVSNPPYIDEQDPHLQQGDVRFEPLTALVAADSGMADIVHIIEQSRNALVSGGFLLLEHGWQQGEAVRQAFILAGYHDVETCRDYGDNERVTLGRYYQ